MGHTQSMIGLHEVVGDLRKVYRMGTRRLESGLRRSRCLLYSQGCAYKPRKVMHKFCPTREEEAASRSNLADAFAHPRLKQWLSYYQADRWHRGHGLNASYGALSRWHHTRHGAKVYASTTLCPWKILVSLRVVFLPERHQVLSTAR